MIGAALYVLLFSTACSVGLPLGFALFGRRHAAGWISGALIGYGLTALTLWGVVQAGVPSPGAFVAAFVAVSVAIWIGFARRGPWVQVPPWRRRDTAALVLVLLLVPALQWHPFTRLGERDDSGARRYRAYFTADVLWHTALTAELGTFTSPPRNPYLARRPLHYYWGYFVLPAVVSSTAPVLPDVLSHLLVNAFCAGLLFVAAIFVTAWCIVPRAGPVAAAVICVLVAASAEGTYALWQLWSRGAPLAAVRELNIDAITAWWFGTLTIDSLPRSLWYTPQHAMACALSLMALTVAARIGDSHHSIGDSHQFGDSHGIGDSHQFGIGIGGCPQFAAALTAGVALGLALIFSPFLGGTFSLIFGLTAAWRALAAQSPILLVRTATAALPVGLALAWCLASGTFEGARGTVALGLSRTAAHAPLTLITLAAGPILALTLLALLLRTWRRWPLAMPIVAVTTGLALLYFVTLTLEPVWIGWRAGQIILVTVPALAAAAFAAMWDRGWRRTSIAVAALVLALGLPTTVIDAYNAQDVSNTGEAAGFRWTLVVPADSQAALAWIREHTPRRAIVQMSIGPRRRDSWTLVPTFAERRMAAGRPISLLHTAEYDQLSDRVDELFRMEDPAEAGRLARRMRIDYLFIDEVERRTFDPAALAKFEGSPYFTKVFEQGTAAVYAVR